MLVLLFEKHQRFLLAAVKDVLIDVFKKIKSNKKQCLGTRYMITQTKSKLKGIKVKSPCV